MAYSEHVGVNRQAGGNQGERTVLYARTSRIPNELGEIVIERLPEGSTIRSEYPRTGDPKRSAGD